ncbi:MAG: ATP-dependent DNA helicase PIF1 [Parcubacteria bacterium C7867-002]|nr:MAG: ATP-dependent DNA helicase PIF1 [Parcubacteria bacterium C7867-002]
MTQSSALSLLKTGANMFITGPAGSGKTHLINEYIKYLQEHGVSVGITASTGIAATHMGGVTIHSWSGMGIRNNFDDRDLEELAEKGYVANRIKDTAVLIIDEVSMLHHFRLDTLNAITKHIRKNDMPFGGLQVVLCGDFFQLPPVSKYGEPDTHFIYRSEAWKEGKFAVCYLSENYRQKDDAHLSILNEIRSGEVSDGAREELKNRYNKRTLTTIVPTRLYTHNADVDAVNDIELGKVSGPETIYEMSSKGKKPLVEALKKSCLAPEMLRLRKGAHVMCVKNNFDKGYVNGTLGTIVSCGFGVDPVIHTAPTPEFPQGRRVTIESASWKIEDDGRVLAEINQYPLRLAWAITVHKSQGMSLDAIEVDLSKSFEPGMGYVALSRVRTLNGLTILGINEAALQVHPEVLEYDRHLRQLSEKAEAVLAGTDNSDIQKAQDEFLAKVAPLYSMGKGKKKKRLGIEKVSTYAKTAKLVRSRVSLGEMANEREMTVETIIAHLEQLVGSVDESEKLSTKDIEYLKYEISSQHFGKIQKALEEVSLKQKDGKPPLLSSVKSKVPANITFKDIRLARVLLGYIGKEHASSGE